MTNLTEGTLLQGGKYRIEKTLGQGGFGITYLAMQSGLERQVAVKEFFMKDCCTRHGDGSRVTLGTEGMRGTVERFREKFMKEARNIAHLKHPNIVQIMDVFEENGTAYYVMEYAEGGSLADRVKAQGCLSEADATGYIRQVADALGYVHGRKMNHLDVKPGNIMLTGNGNAMLIDFGLAKQYDATTGGQTSTTPIGISDGYAPTEQYKPGGVSTFSPETDIYALGATYYNLLTGVKPPSASDVLQDGVPTGELERRGVSRRTIELIARAMEPRTRDRFHSIAEFVQALPGERAADNARRSGQAGNAQADEETVVIGAQNPKLEEKRDPATKPAAAAPQAGDAKAGVESTGRGKPTRKPGGVVVAVVVAIVVGVGMWLAFGRGISDELPDDLGLIDSPQCTEMVANERMTINGNLCYYTGEISYTGSALVADGEGEATFDNGCYYKGPFSNGLMHGSNAYYTYANGDIFRGSFVNNVFSKGTYTVEETGEYFTGTFNNQGQPKKGTWYDKYGNMLEEI